MRTGQSLISSVPKETVSFIAEVQSQERRLLNSSWEVLQPRKLVPSKTSVSLIPDLTVSFHARYPSLDQDCGSLGFSIAFIRLMSPPLI